MKHNYEFTTFNTNFLLWLMDYGFQGGFSIFGQEYKNLPFDIIWANDFNKEACNTYKRNLGHDIHCGDVWQLLETT